LDNKISNKERNITLKELLQFIVDGGNIVRYHTAPGLKPNTNAHHSHGVAMLCIILWSDSGRLPRAELLAAALTHDLAEQVASDVSAPAKRLLGIRKQLHDLEQDVLKEYKLDYEKYLSQEEQRILSLADTLDGLLYTCEEIARGNKKYNVLWGRWQGYVSELTPDLSPHELNVINAIFQIHEEAISAQGPTFNCFAK
jgi:5'-deoxynucleotidase YfbR-like HD superfamily hydrolase